MNHSMTPGLDSWENEGGRVAPKPPPLSAVELAIIEEFWAMQETIDSPPPPFEREVA